MPKPRQKPVHPHAALLNAIGAKAVREQFGLSLQRYHAWTVNGVPYTHRAAVAQLLMLQGSAIPNDFLDPPERAVA